RCSRAVSAAVLADGGPPSARTLVGALAPCCSSPRSPVQCVGIGMTAALGRMESLTLRRYSLITGETGHGGDVLDAAGLIAEDDVLAGRMQLAAGGGEAGEHERYRQIPRDGVLVEWVELDADPDSRISMAMTLTPRRSVTSPS